MNQPLTIGIVAIGGAVLVYLGLSVAVALVLGAAIQLGEDRRLTCGHDVFEDHE